MIIGFGYRSPVCRATHEPLVSSCLVLKLQINTFPVCEALIASDYTSYLQTRQNIYVGVSLPDASARKPVSAMLFLACR